MALETRLLDILACPKDKGPLLYFADEETLYNPRLRLKYRVTDGIPVMLIDEADEADEAEAARLTAKAEAEGIEPAWSDAGGDVGPASDDGAAEAR